MYMRHLALLLVLLPLSAYSRDPSEKALELCQRRSVGTVAHIRIYYPSMTEREIMIARDAAIAGCLEGYKQGLNPALNETKPIASKAKRDSEPTVTKSKKGKKSLLDWVLGEEHPDKDLPTIRKRQRTGGK